MRSQALRSTSREATLLVVDDNPVTREVVGVVLRRLTLDVCEADSGEAAITAIRARRFDLVLLDFRLPDISGLDVVATLKKERISIPWVLMSGRMTAPLAVQAMKLGAIDAVGVPFDIEGVVLSALGDLRTSGSDWPVLASRLPEPKSAAERWAVLVLRACAAGHDLRTIDDWAKAAAASYSTLTESCRLVGIRPYDARDFLRMLRTLYHAQGRTENLEHALAISDYRTLKRMFERAGLSLGRRETISLRGFIEGQTFVAPDSEPVRWLVRLLECGRDNGGSDKDSAAADMSCVCRRQQSEARRGAPHNPPESSCWGYSLS
ncbi:MAG TPA: response regulator [Vicinamibacterales bacterium]|nr:response regulator [Vicinamibacterales bacterium]